MDIKELYEGRVFKNYKELCLVLGEDIKSGSRNRKSHMEMISQYCNWKKQGHKIIIESVHSEPIIRDQSLNRIQFKSIIEELILHLLATNDTYKYHNKKGLAYLSKTNMIMFLAIANENYRQAKFRIEKTAKLLDIDIRIVDEFFSMARKDSETLVRSSLNSLKNRGVIWWNESVNVVTLKNSCDTEKHELKNKYDEDEVVYKNVQKYDHNEATDPQKNAIRKIERSVMKDMGFKKVTDIFLGGKMKDYKRKCEERTFEEIGVVCYYDVYKIGYGEDEIAEDLESFYLEGMDLSSKIKELNENVCSRFSKKLKNRSKSKDLKKVEFKNRYGYRLTEEYIKSGKNLIENLINIGAEDIVEELKCTKLTSDTLDGYYEKRKSTWKTK